MHVEIDVKCMPEPILVGANRAFLVSEILHLFHTFKIGQTFPFRPWTIVHGSSKNLID